jgi:YHS domain-containing protein
MRRLSLVLAAMALAAVAARAQQGGQPEATAPETTMDGAKAMGTQEPAQSVKTKTHKATVKDYTPKASEYGKKVKCPLEGAEFKVGPDTKAVKYKGKIYYFCCDDCLAQFKKHPAKYAK